MKPTHNNPSPTTTTRSAAADSQRPNELRPQVLNLDWLAFSVTLAYTYTERAEGHAVLKAPAGYTLVECKHGTPQYKRRVLLQTEEGDKLSTLLLEPHSKIINPQDMYCEIANPLLYTDNGVNRVRELIDAVHTSSFRSLSRLDVACDFEPTEHQRAVIAGLQSADIYVQGKREGCQFHDYDLTAGSGAVKKSARAMSWGGKQSSIKWKLYNKSLELYTTDDRGRQWCSKPYIPATWAEHGMGSQGIWRLEVSLTGASSYDWRGEKMGWDIVTSGAWRDFFYDMVATRFVTRKNEGHLCRKNDTFIALLDDPTEDHYRLRERQGDGDQPHTDFAATLRTCVKELERPEVAFSPQWRDMWLRTTAEVLDKGHLHGYFLRTFGQTFEEYACTIGDELLQQ